MKLSRPQQQEENQRRGSSIRSKAAHFVTDLTTVILNPISDKPSSGEVTGEPRRNTQQCNPEEDVPVLVDGPDTSSFTAFLYSFLSPGRSEKETEYAEWKDNQSAAGNRNDTPSPNVKENSGKKGLISRGKQSIGKALTQAVRFGGGYRYASGKVNNESKTEDGKETGSTVGKVEGVPVKNPSESILPSMSEPSQLMTEYTRAALYAALPVLSQGKKWVLLYSTWRHGISLSTLYRRSSLCSGLSLLVVGDTKGAVFGGLVEAPLRPSTKKRYQLRGPTTMTMKVQYYPYSIYLKLEGNGTFIVEDPPLLSNSYPLSFLAAYQTHPKLRYFVITIQGSNNTFVFTNASGPPVIFRPTGANRYFTLCSTEYLALGGGSHFALYLDSDLLNGSSLASETYGNSCLSHTQEFGVKEIELWGFVYASEYEETISMLRTEAPGICRW